MFDTLQPEGNDTVLDRQVIRWLPLSLVLRHPFGLSIDFFDLPPMDSDGVVGTIGGYRGCIAIRRPFGGLGGYIDQPTVRQFYWSGSI